MGKLAIIIGIFVAALVIVAGVYYFTANSQDTLTARKEDLQTTQQNVDQQIAALNTSVQAAVQEQQTLNAQVAALEKNTTNTTTAPATPQTTDTSATQTTTTTPPVRTPTTRAS